MDYRQLHKIIDDLSQGQRAVSEYENDSVSFIKAIAWEFALRYKHTQDKESSQAEKYLSILIELRQMAKGKLNLEDKTMQRFLKERN